MFMDTARRIPLFVREVEVLPRRGEQVGVQWEGRIRQFTVVEVKHTYATGARPSTRLG